VITVDNITKSYPIQGFSRYYVFRNLSLHIPPKTSVGILGRNGAGKSTLLRLIGGIELPDRGSVRSDGLISPPVGLSGGFSGKLTGRDNARFVARISGDDRDMERERVEFVHAFSELGDFFERPVETYSAGMRARLAFSISMSFDFDYYLIDELTAVGDRGFKDKAKKTFDDLKGRATVIMVSHNLAEMQRDCDVGIYLRKGEVHYFPSIDDAIATYKEETRPQ
jgi:capsular polysaccharide transport system ATP-binding protein